MCSALLPAAQRGYGQRRQLNVAVTGGSGFIGSHVVDGLIARGDRVRIIDLVPSPYLLPGEVETAIGDLVDLDFVRDAVRGCDAVVHLAAVSDVNEVVLDPARAEMVNAGGTRTLLEAARLEGIGTVVYASTIWVYGDRNGEVVDEDAALQLPTHFYTATKLAGEMYCTSYVELFGLDCRIARFGIPYGPRARSATVLAAFAMEALRGEPLTIHGDGSQSRRFVYAEDLAEGVLATLTAGMRGRTYNLVGDESITVRTIAETVCSLIRPVPIVHLEARFGDLRGAEISGERAARELGWKPRTSFREGAARYIAWLMESSGAPSASAASAILGIAPAVALHEPGEL
ncbi:MAG TPA: NAD-dependent epimerase/dehydratase family protein [Gaiellaceae bacterium]|nr:NAD-dependent epimerase/dehydratase family protein [Gaiellaceae bacterium]